MSYDRNPYYNPETFGLEKVGEIDLSEPNYSFDMLAVWKNADGIFLATDSGCSCPTPFENYGSLDELTGPLTSEHAEEEIRSQANKEQYVGGDFVTKVYDETGVDALVEAVRAA